GMGLSSSLACSMPSATKSSAYLASPVTLACTSGGRKSWPSSLYAISRLPCGTHDGFEIVVVGAAPAQIAGHRQTRFLDGGLGIRFQERHGRHDLAGGAVAALRPEFGDEGLLDRMQLAVRPGEALHGGDRLVAHLVGQRGAAVIGDVVDIDGAGAAFAAVAAELGAGEAQ